MSVVLCANSGQGHDKILTDSRLLSQNSSPTFWEGTKKKTCFLAFPVTNEHKLVRRSSAMNFKLFFLAFDISAKKLPFKLQVGVWTREEGGLGE